jgi:hypothetical protein
MGSRWKIRLRTFVVGEQKNGESLIMTVITMRSNLGSLPGRYRGNELPPITDNVCSLTPESRHCRYDEL